MRVLVCGSRTWGDVVTLKARLQSLPPDTVIVHGAARGADETADRIAKRLGMTTEPHPADWKKHGRAAGPIRNDEMLDSKPDLVIAFWDGKSPGTKHTIDGANLRGIPTEVYGPCK